MTPPALAVAGDLVRERLRDRTEANAAYFRAQEARIAALCEAMAARFADGGRLLASGTTPAARSDARHVAVEFVHPVIVGKRALPALAVEPGDVALLAEPGDVVLGFGPDGSLTVGCGPGPEWVFPPGAEDPFVAQELGETLYHLLWELVHVFLDHRTRPGRDTGASSFLYPMLGGQSHDPAGVVADVRRSIAMKAAEVTALRAQTLTEFGDRLVTVAGVLRRSLDAGGQLLALGNGGSATDAMDMVADFRAPHGPGPARRALDLSEDPGIITAIANDIGTEAVFSRQVIAYGRRGDVLVAISTSGSSLSVLHALREARGRGLETVALVGYDGGRVAHEGLADHVVISRSEHIPRIQEAQASASHVLRELVEL